MYRFAGHSRRTTRRRALSSPTHSDRDASKPGEGRSGPTSARHRQFDPTPSESWSPSKLRFFQDIRQPRSDPQGSHFIRAAPARKLEQLADRCEKVVEQIHKRVNDRRSPTG